MLCVKVSTASSNLKFCIIHFDACIFLLVNNDHQVMFTNVILIKLTSSILSSKVGKMESIVIID
jgi:hypothetical protein